MVRFYWKRLILKIPKFKGIHYINHDLFQCLQSCGHCSSLRIQHNGSYFKWKIQKFFFKTMAHPSNSIKVHWINASYKSICYKFCNPSNFSLSGIVSDEWFQVSDFFHLFFDQRIYEIQILTTKRIWKKTTQICVSSRCPFTRLTLKYSAPIFSSSPSLFLCFYLTIVLFTHRLFRLWLRNIFS